MRQVRCIVRLLGLDLCVAGPGAKAHLGRGVDSEAELGLLAIVHREALQQKGAKAGASASSHSVEHQETLQTCGTAKPMRDMHPRCWAAMSESVWVRAALHVVCDSGRHDGSWQPAVLSSGKFMEVDGHLKQGFGMKWGVLS